MNTLAVLVLLITQAGLLSNDSDLLLDVAGKNAAARPPESFTAQYSVNHAYGDLGRADANAGVDLAQRSIQSEHLLEKQDAIFAITDDVTVYEPDGKIHQQYRDVNFFDGKALRRVSLHPRIIPVFEEYAAPRADSDNTEYRERFQDRLNNAVAVDISMYWGRSGSVNLQDAIEGHGANTYWEIEERSPKVFVIKPFSKGEGTAPDGEYVIDGNAGYLMTSVKAFTDGQPVYKLEVVPANANGYWYPAEVRAWWPYMKTHITVDEFRVVGDSLEHTLTWETRGLDISSGSQVKFDATGTAEIVQASGAAQRRHFGKTRS